MSQSNFKFFEVPPGPRIQETHAQESEVPLEHNVIVEVRVEAEVGDAIVLGLANSSGEADFSSQDADADVGAIVGSAVYEALDGYASARDKLDAYVAEEELNAAEANIELAFGSDAAEAYRRLVDAVADATSQ